MGRGLWRGGEPEHAHEQEERSKGGAGHGLERCRRRAARMRPARDSRAILLPQRSGGGGGGGGAVRRFAWALWAQALCVGTGALHGKRRCWGAEAGSGRGHANASRTYENISQAGAREGMGLRCKGLPAEPSRIEEWCAGFGHRKPAVNAANRHSSEREALGLACIIAKTRADAGQKPGRSSALSAGNQRMHFVSL